MEHLDFKSIRARGGWTQPQIAERIGVSLETVKRYESAPDHHRHTQIPSQIEAKMRLIEHGLDAQSIGELSKNIVIKAIENADDPSQKKERIMVAYEEGLLTSDEASDWISLLGLQTA
jgi:transcriptional regulator with XRE-family HTH domain